MITGRPIQLVPYAWEQLKSGVQLDPPDEAYRAYIAAEGGVIRWCYSIDDQPKPGPTSGFPLEPGYPEEFDTDLKYIWLWAGAQDCSAVVYYMRSA